MNLIYPIQAILMYFSILLAPPDTERITVEMPKPSPGIELVRNGKTWESGGDAFTVDGANLVVFGPNGRESVGIGDFVALPGDHDWTKKPSFTLGDSTIIEKSEAGFTIRRNSTGGEGNGVYQIRNHKPGNGAAVVAVNVLGQVVNQGVHRVPADGTVRDAIAAAGGPAASAEMKKVSITRGPAGTVPMVTKLDLTNVEGSDPQILAGDTIHVAASEEGDPKLAERLAMVALAEHWLSLVDAAEYDRSWKDAAEFFKNSITVDAWGESMTKVRKPLGNMKSRKIRDMKEVNALPGAPDGNYRIIQFDTSFNDKAEAVETVVYKLEKDGTWKASGFFIK